MLFKVKGFRELTIRELYEIYKLRAEVFVVEQNCPYQDVDEMDLSAHHVMLQDEDLLVGYSRILPPGVSYPEPAIGRVLVKKQYRQKGLGILLMNHSIAKTIELHQAEEIVISAQTYLLGFYESLGFIKEGEEYHEDDIPHTRMRYRLREQN
jgi:ElaA protein